MALTPKQQAWCEEWNISPRLVDAISEALRNEASPIAKTDACPKCNMYSCPCAMNEFPFGLESTDDIREQWADAGGAVSGQPEISSITPELSKDAKKERKLRDKAEKLVANDLKTRLNHKKDQVKMYPNTDAPN